MLGLALGIFAAGGLALLLSLVLFWIFRFERFVGLRYLLRGRASRAARTGLAIAGLTTVVGIVALVVGRGGSRGLETAGVVLTLLGGLGVMLFVLLRIFSVFTTVSTMGVVLGVASLVVVLAVTSGFEREFREKVLAVNAHMIVSLYGMPAPDEAEREVKDFASKLAGLPGLVGAETFSLSIDVMIGPVGANLKGVDLVAGGRDLARALVKGKIEALSQPASCPAPTLGTGEDDWTGRIVLGAELARRLRADVGSCVTVLIPFSGEAADAPPRAQRFQVVGIFQMGFYEYDTRLAYIPLEDARRLGDLSRSIYGLELRFTDAGRALTVEPEIEARLGPNAHIVDWKTLNRNLFTALAMQKVIIALFLVLIIVVAAFNIVASLTMIVLSKVREIAILGSMGARARAVLRIFLAAGSLVGFVGIGLGLIYGLLVCALARVYGYPLDPKVYLIEKLPVQLDLAELLFVAASTQLVCVLATIYPAVRATRLKIVDGLRFT